MLAEQFKKLFYNSLNLYTDNQLTNVRSLVIGYRIIHAYHMRGRMRGTRSHVLRGNGMHCFGYTQKILREWHVPSVLSCYLLYGKSAADNTTKRKEFFVHKKNFPCIFKG